MTAKAGLLEAGPLQSSSGQSSSGQPSSTLLSPAQATGPQVGQQSVVLFQDRPLLLDSGQVLTQVRVAYHTYGQPRPDATLVLHALTGNSAVEQWWSPLWGEGKALDPTRDFIVCANVLGGCAGSTSALELQQQLGQPVQLSLFDLARVGRALLEHLRIERVKIVGGSLGGMLAYAWLLECPDLVERAAIIAAPARHSPWAIGLNTAQRSAIAVAPGGEGLKVARQIATLSYRSPESLALTQSGERAPGLPAITSYLNYQGEKLAARFCEHSYLAITHAMDALQIDDRTLSTIRCPVLVVGISSDVLYPPAELKAQVALLPRGEYWELESPHGHDAFLMDALALTERVKKFLQTA